MRFTFHSRESTDVLAQAKAAEEAEARYRRKFLRYRFVAIVLCFVALAAFIAGVSFGGVAVVKPQPPVGCQDAQSVPDASLLSSKGRHPVGMLRPQRRSQHPATSRVRRCWTTDPGMLDLDKMQVVLSLTTDVAGIVRRAVVAPEDAGRRANDAKMRVFASRATRAVLTPIAPIFRCRNP